MKAWDLLRSQFKPDGKGRYKTVDAMKVAEQLEEEVNRLSSSLTEAKKLLKIVANAKQDIGSTIPTWIISEKDIKHIRKFVKDNNISSDQPRDQRRDQHYGPLSDPILTNFYNMTNGQNN